MSSIDWSNEAEVDAFIRTGLLLANTPRMDLPPIPHEFSERYKRWERKFLADPFGYIKRKSRPIWLKVLRTAAVIILTFAVTLAGLMAVSPTVRAAVIRWFVETFQTHQTYRFVGESEGQSNARWYPAYLPDGYVEVDYQDVFGYVKIVFENEAGARIYFEYQPTEDGAALQIDNEEVVITETTIGNSPAFIYQSIESGKSNTVLWMDEEENTSFFLTAFEPCELLIRIAESVKPAE